MVEFKGFAGYRCEAGSGDTEEDALIATAPERLYLPLVVSRKEIRLMSALPLLPLAALPGGINSRSSLHRQHQLQLYIIKLHAFVPWNREFKHQKSCKRIWIHFQPESKNNSYGHFKIILSKSSFKVIWANAAWSSRTQSPCTSYIFIVHRLLMER